MIRRPLSTVLVLLVFVLGLGACGGGDGDEEEGEPAAGGTTLQLAADPEGGFAFDKTSLSAKAGTVTIELTNDSSLPHDISVEGNGVDESSRTALTSTTSLTLELEPGTYTFYCSVDNHREQGMEGTLTIE
jgi:plastocyanin